MPAENYVVLRNSPDWLSFDPETSREFCRRGGIPERTVIDFVALWDAVFPIGYRQMRHELKQIALRSYTSVLNTHFLECKDFARNDVEEDDLVVFVDDDDWLAPDLFERLREYPIPNDGFAWGSIRLGANFEDNRGSANLVMRPICPTIYTNNYAVTGRCLRRVGIEHVFEHYNAQLSIREKVYLPILVEDYLSVANKHVVSTVFANTFLQYGNFISNPRQVIARISADMEKIDVAEKPIWIEQRVTELVTLMKHVIGRE